MRHTLRLLCITILFMTGCTSELHKKFRELDHVLAQRDRYEIKLETEADSLHTLLSKAENDSVK